MSQIKTLFYFFPFLRRVLFRKATKQDPIISRIKLLEEFENTILAIDEIENFHDIQYESLKVDSFSQSMMFSNFIPEEISFIIKLPKTRFSTSNFSVIETHANDSSLTDMIIGPQVAEVQLNSSYSLSLQNVVHFTNSIANLQDFEEISSPIVKLPKSCFLTYNNSSFTDKISEPQDTELQLDFSSQNERHLINNIADSQDFKELPIVKLPKTRFSTNYTVTNSTNNSNFTNKTSELQHTELQLDVSSQNEIHSINSIFDSQDFKELPIVKLPKMLFSSYEVINSSVIETHASNSSLADIFSKPQDTGLQLNGSSLTTSQIGVHLTSTKDNSQDNELQLNKTSLFPKNDKIVAVSSYTFSPITKVQIDKSPLCKSIAKEEIEARKQNVLTPYLTSLYSNQGYQVYPSYRYYLPTSNYGGYGQHYDSSLGGHYQTQYQFGSSTIEPNHTIKKGDWFCDKCFQHNFAKRNRCYFCQVVKSGIAIQAKCAGF
ncbi:hypothetical protein C1645_820866 [Glomus cerebriforme]|uniref:RanBP2-type domain-containing protein n=1 Tax=Glomus cerebriforme TaxID=658196 RepID=A0A397T7W7_9GLOM|nr:hypothetical protein C1645_820866 [Glomus cerebriforme]